MSKKTEALPAAESQIAEFNATETALADLRHRHEKLTFDVTTTKGMDEAKKARAELRGLRTALEEKRVELKAPILERGRLLDAEAKRITGELVALEEPIDAQIKAEEQRKERERVEREEARQRKIAETQRRFDALKGLLLQAPGKTVDEISGFIAQAEAFDPESFDDEYKAAAQFERQMVVNGLKAARDRRAAEDRQAAETAEKLKRLEELEAKEREREAEQRRQEEERERAAAEEDRKRREHEAQERAQREEAEREALRQREAEIAERERVAAAERAEADRLAKIERDRIAAEQAEKHRAAEAAAKAERERLAAERKRLEEEAARLAAEKEQREIGAASLVEAASEALPLLREGYPRHKATKKLAAALAREQKQAA